MKAGSPRACCTACETSCAATADRRDRAAVVVLRREPHGLRLGIVVIARRRSSRPSRTAGPPRRADGAQAPRRCPAGRAAPRRAARSTRRTRAAGRTRAREQAPMARGWAWMHTSRSSREAGPAKNGCRHRGMTRAQFCSLMFACSTILPNFSASGTHEGAILRRAHRARHDALHLKLLGDRLVAQAVVHHLVEPRDDRLRRAGRREQAEPVEQLVVLQLRRRLGERRARRAAAACARAT